MTNNWIEEFNKKYYTSVFDAYGDYKESHKILLDDIQTFITTLLEKQMEEYVEMIRGYKFSSWNGEEEVEKGIEEIITLIKTHDKNL